MSSPRPWYHRPEWLVAIGTMLASVIGGATAIAHNDAQTAQNTQDIRDLKGQMGTIPERLARIETKVDDLTAIEKHRSGLGD